MTAIRFRHLSFVPVLGLALMSGNGLFSDPVEGLAAEQRGRGRGAPQGPGPATVEFIVVSADGTPVADLTAADVSLRIDGRDKTIVALERVEAGTPGAGGAGLPPPYGSNSGAPGRTVYFAIEDESIRPGAERVVREMVELMLGKLPASDRAGLMTLPKPSTRLDPTTDRDAVRKAVAEVQGRDTQGTNDEETCRSRDTLEGLRGLIGALAGAEGPKTVLFFSTALNAASRAAGAISSGGCEITTEHYQNVGVAAAAAGAQLYIIQAEEQVSQRNEGLETLAGVSGGGQVLRMSGSENPIERIARETSSYYVARFQAEAGERDGQGHRLELKVARDGVVTRVPTEFVSRRGRGGPAGDGPIAPREMLKSPAPFRGLPVRVVGYPSRQPGDKLRILVLAEPEDPSVKFTAAAVGIVDPTGRMQQVGLDEKALGSVPVITALEATPGTYRLRFAATDASGRSGAADYELHVQLTDAGPLKLSGLVLGTLRNGAFAPAMHFTNEPSAIAYLEVYGQITGNVSARAELAKTADGPAIATVQPGGQRSSEPDKVFLTAEIPIASLEPGDYVVRLFMQLEGQPEGRVMHTLRKGR